MSEPYEPTEDGANAPEDITPPPETGTVTLTGFQAYVAEQLDRLSTLNEAQLEANMRLYDALVTLITILNNMDRTMELGLREQHANGQYYFPPFALTEDVDGQAADSSQD